LGVVKHDAKHDGLRVLSVANGSAACAEKKEEEE